MDNLPFMQSQSSIYMYRDGKTTHLLPSEYTVLRAMVDLLFYKEKNSVGGGACCPFAPKLPHSPRGKGTLNWDSTQPLCPQRGGVSCFIHSPCEVSVGAQSAGEAGCHHLLWQCPPLHCFTLRTLLDMLENLIF